MKVIVTTEVEVDVERDKAQRRATYISKRIHDAAAESIGLSKGTRSKRVRTDVETVEYAE